MHVRIACRPRSGFTMVELLVVITIIGILMAMLMPAINNARESGRRVACSSNIRNLAVALKTYHTSHRVFPPALQFDRGEDPTASVKYKANWIICILPQIGQEPLYKKFDLKHPISDSANSEWRGIDVEVLQCPSDSGVTRKFSRGEEGDNWARGNYGANSMLVPLATADLGPASLAWNTGWKRGVLGGNVACREDDITDGASNTILLGELRIGLAMSDRRGIWAMGAPGASSFWGHGTDNAIGPNNCAEGSDQILGCSEIGDEINSEELVRNCMPCGGSQNTHATMRSRHPGGVNVCMVDGSVHFITDSIEKSSSPTLSLKDFRTWERLNASADRLPVDASKL